MQTAEPGGTFCRAQQEREPGSVPIDIDATLHPAAGASSDGARGTPAGSVVLHLSARDI